MACDINEAIKWYRRAAEQGYDRAQHGLARRYRKGEGVEKDFEEAVKWYFLAAQQGFAPAQNSLGNRYRKGQGVPMCPLTAFAWYKIAELNGNSTANRNLRKIAQTMTPEQIAEAEAFAAELIRTTSNFVGRDE